MKQLAPEQMAGWKATGVGQLFDRQNIFTHLNGGAEVYLHYGLVRLLAQEYVRARAPSVSLSIFDMGHARNAYGIFTHEREGVAANVGQDSDHAGGLLRFWRGRYFVAISSFRVTKTARRAALELGREVASRIERPGKRPLLVARLPANQLDAGSVRYLQSEAILHLHWPRLAGSKLGLDSSSEVVVARYGASEDPLEALVASFASPAGAARAQAGLVKKEDLEGKLATRVCGQWLLVVARGKGAKARSVHLLGRLSKSVAANEECFDGAEKK